MDKIFLTTRRICCRNCFVWRGAISRFFSESSHSFTESDSSLKYKGLNQDTSWEAEVLRHEKLLDRLKKEGVESEDLPEFEREAKVKNLPHLSFCDKANLEKDELLLDETSKLMLGNLTEKQEIHLDGKTLTNIDPDFARADVQEVLRRIHYFCDLNKVYRQHITKRMVMPSVKYLTDEQLQEEMRKFTKKGTEKLEMPPVMLQRKQCSEILAEDHVLDGYEESNVSFVDISEGLHNRERFIVMREPNGTLRKAEWEERDRLLQTYYPVPERKIIPSSFFDKENLENIFEQKLHENALDQCISQFEPNSRHYIQTFESIYRDIDDKKLYHLLRSTRYFGGLIYFLAKKFSLDGLIADMLNRDMFENAADCVLLLTLLHPRCETMKNTQQLSAKDHTAIIQAYIDSDSNEKKFLSMALEREKSSTVNTTDGDSSATVNTTDGDSSV